MFAKALQRQPAATPKSRPLLGSLYCIALLSAGLTAQNEGLRDLSKDEERAIATITEGKVLATVSFLASDELRGRDTPSPGLRIASAYVAARFRGAGLRGIGPEGSFFLYAKARVLPKTDASVARGGAHPATTSPVLVAANKALEIETMMVDCGKVIGRDAPEVEEIEGVALVTETSITARGLPKSMVPVWALRQQASRVARKGAKAMLVRCKSDSPLRKIAGDLRGKAPSSVRSASMLERMPIPVVLVPATFAAGKAAVTIPAWDHGPSENRNIAAVLDGSDPDLRHEAVVITAHLDHIGERGRGEDKINNGADDNASGCTGVLTLADAFAALPKRPKRSVIFMCFWGEEQGLRGSRYFCEHPSWPLAKIVANINLEMLGRPEADAANKTWMTGWTKSDLGEIVNEGSRRVGVTTFRHPRFSAMLYRRSDNWAFAAKGVVAHSFSAGSLHNDYHQPGDEWEKLQISHMTKVIQGLFAGTLPIAKGLRTPKAR